MPSELPDCKALFVRFLSDNGDDAAARTRFQRLVTDLVILRIPEASEVAFPGGGDWGIDTYVGNLDADIVVWQSKFFTNWGKSQQAEIRSSFKQVIEKAAQRGFTVTAWTLCVPSVLPPDQQKWFDNWSKKQSRETGVRIDLWNGVRIRAALQQADARYLRELYFPDHAPAGSDVPVAALANPVVLSDALFVVQLEAAGRMETNHASAVAESAPTPIMRVGSKAVSSRRSLLRRSLAYAGRSGLALDSGFARDSGLALDIAHEPRNDADDKDDEADPQQELHGLHKNARKEQGDTDDDEDDHKRHE